MTRLSAPVATLGVIGFGTAASLIAKLIYSVQGLNSKGELAPFTKPWFQVFGMFAGMSICILLDLPRRSRRHNLSPRSEEQTPLIQSDQKQNSPHGVVDHSASVWIINVPTLFDLFATACGTTGLLYTTVSVYQMLRGAQLIFTALLSVVFLRRRLSSTNLAGITLCVGGIILVGLANIWGEASPRSRNDTTFGVLIILAGQVLQASQVVLEEHLLQNLEMSSVRIVAYEGMFGCLHCLVWVFPILYFLPGNDAGHIEDTGDAFYMVCHSWQIAAVIATDMAIMLAYNVCGMEVTNNLSAVSRVIIETLRTLFVWICDIILFYVISSGKLGEKWTSYSFLQALGFFLTVAGTLCYNYEHLIADYRRRRKVAAAEKTIENGVTPDGQAISPGKLHDDADESNKEGTSAHIELEATKQKPPSDDRIVRTTQPLKMNFDDDYDWDQEEADDDDDDDEAVGSFLGSAVGSASHGSYLAGSLTSSSLRGRDL